MISVSRLIISTILACFYSSIIASNIDTDTIQVFREAFSKSCNVEVLTAYNTPSRWANVYKILLDDSPAVLRVVKTGNLSNFENEVYICKYFAEKGVSPHIFWTDNKQLILMQYLESSDFDKGCIKILANKIKQIHSTNSPIQKSMLDEKFEESVQKISHLNTEPKFQLIFKALESYYKLAEDMQEKYNKCFCHNDLNHTNILATGGDPKDVFIIDWDHAGLNYPLIDLATVILSQKFSLAEEEEFLSDYYDEPVNINNKSGLETAKTLTLLRYGIIVFSFCKDYHELPYPQDLTCSTNEAFLFDKTLPLNLGLYKLSISFINKALDDLKL